MSRLFLPISTYACKYSSVFWSIRFKAEAKRASEFSYLDIFSLTGLACASICLLTTSIQEFTTFSRFKSIDPFTFASSVTYDQIDAFKTPIEVFIYASFSFTEPKSQLRGCDIFFPSFQASYETAKKYY